MIAVDDALDRIFRLLRKVDDSRLQLRENSSSRLIVEVTRRILVWLSLPLLTFWTFLTSLSSLNFLAGFLYRATFSIIPRLASFNVWIYAIVGSGGVKAHALRASSQDFTVQVAVTLMSGETIAEMMMPGSATVHQVRKEVAARDQASTSVGKCKLLLQGRVLSNEATVRDLIEEDHSRICTLQLIRLGSRTCTVSESSDCDLMCTFVLLGDSGTGKSNIMSRFASGEFTASFISTIGVDMRITNVGVVNEAVVAKLTIWDTGGQARFRRIAQAYYRMPGVLLLVFDTSTRESFENLTDWLHTIQRHARSDAIVYLVGNKTDLARSVSVSEAEAFAASNGLKYFEMSAKTGTDVHAPFYHGTDVLIDRSEGL